MSKTPVDLTARESVDVLRHIVGPLVAEGAIVRRPRVAAWAERRQVDRRVNLVLDELRERFDGAPLVVHAGPRRLVLVCEHDDVARLLDGSPEPFTPATLEKRGALRQFEPDAVLISPAPERRRRRPINERALGLGRPVPDVGEVIVEHVARMAATLSETARENGELDAATFIDSWWELVRVVTLGERARDDRLLIDRLASLRSAANWSYLHPVRKRLREAFARQVAEHVRLAEPGSLAAAGRAAAASLGSGERAAYDVAGQLPQWLFAFDAAGMATLRALAVASAQPEVGKQLESELTTAGSGAVVLPYARACVLESVRLWPTTLVILRDSTEPTTWGERTLPAGTGYAIVSGYVHRDRRRIDFADAFAPEAWLDGRADADRALVPFSAGPAECAGRDVVLFTTSHLLARLAALDLVVDRGEYLSDDPLPATVDHFGLRFRLGGRGSVAGGSVGQAGAGRDQAAAG